LTENDGYEKGEENSLRITDRGQRSPDDDEYSYAYTDAVPQTNRRGKKGHPINQGRLLKLLDCNYKYWKIKPRYMCLI
jgi:hypothetical protein